MASANLESAAWFTTGEDGGHRTGLRDHTDTGEIAHPYEAFKDDHGHDVVFVGGVEMRSNHARNTGVCTSNFPSGWEIFWACAYSAEAH